MEVLQSGDGDCVYYMSSVDHHPIVGCYEL